MRTVSVAAVLALIVGCASARASANGSDGRLAFKAHVPHSRVTPGVTRLGLAPDRDGFLFVPHDNSSDHPAPLVVLLHGATQRARMFERLAAAADSAGVALLAPDSRGVTWDVVRGGFGPDVAFLNRAIDAAFDRAHIDSCRVVIAGFSDGASYALSLGIRNARLFHGVVAFSPGFIVPADSFERLPVFVRHGTQDEILPIDGASRRIVPMLRDAGFPVDYEEFDGPHTVRPADSRAALRWASERTCAAAPAVSGTESPASADNGIVTIASRHPVGETVDRLEQLLRAKGIKLFAMVDHSGEAKAAGFEMRPTKLLIFGNPKAGTPLILASPSIAIDLPLKVLVWQDAAGKVWLSYNAPEYLERRHDLPANLLQPLAGVAALAKAAAE